EFIKACCFLSYNLKLSHSSCGVFFLLCVCTFIVLPSVGITRSTKTPTTVSVKEETKTSSPTSSSVTSLSVAPTFSPNVTLGPTYVTTVNSSDSDNVTTRTASTDSVVTTVSLNGTWLPDHQLTDASTEPWEGNSSTVATTPETFPPSDETPIIAVMVALSSLLVIVFIIIVLYMLRTPERATSGQVPKHQQEVSTPARGQAGRGD
uniref:Protein tyrosine phosphatase receptor type A n=1 Tax=Suricata suricatta TaxID=37032 RepID=A0A673UBD5_SURSU